MNFMEWMNGNAVVMECMWELVQWLTPFIVLIVTLHDNRKQNMRYKKQEVKIQYLKECLEWLNGLQTMGYEISDKGMICLCAKDLETFAERHQQFSMAANVMMEKCLVSIPIYNDLAISLGVKVDLGTVRGITGRFLKEMRSASKERFTGKDEDAAGLINICTDIFMDDIRKITVEVSKVLVPLLENN